MKKTSVYLGEEDEARLKRLAERGGLSFAAIVRAALREYEHRHEQPRISLLAGQFASGGKPVSQMTAEEFDALLEGFGA